LKIVASFFTFVAVGIKFSRELNPERSLILIMKVNISPCQATYSVIKTYGEVALKGGILPPLPPGPDKQPNDHSYKQLFGPQIYPRHCGENVFLSWDYKPDFSVVYPADYLQF